MKKSITTQVINSNSLEDLYSVLQALPVDQVQDILSSTDQELKQLLVEAAHTIHISMESHHHIGSIDTISRQFVLIKRYLKYSICSYLPLHEKIFIGFMKFFLDEPYGDGINSSLEKIEQCQRELLLYNELLLFKSKDFLRYMNAYTSWFTTLTKFHLDFVARHGVDDHLHYSVSKMIMHASEFLTAQRQLEETVKLQIQSNQTILTDVTHILLVSQSLVRNSISAKNFFEKNYVGSITILNKYTKQAHGCCIDELFLLCEFFLFFLLFTFISK